MCIRDSSYSVLMFLLQCHPLYLCICGCYPVSYTHLDVYKRQILSCQLFCRYQVCEWLTVSLMMGNLATHELCPILCFLLAKNNTILEIHRQACEVYRPNILSDSKVRQWHHLIVEEYSWWKMYLSCNTDVSVEGRNVKICEIGNLWFQNYIFNFSAFHSQ